MNAKTRNKNPKSTVLAFIESLGILQIVHYKRAEYVHYKNKNIQKYKEDSKDHLKFPSNHTQIAFKHGDSFKQTCSNM